MGVGPVDLASGSIFAGDYRIVRPLAQGGMGAVFVVDQISTGKSRALKLMHRDLADDPDLRRRFEQEAKIGGRIESEHVVEIVAAGVDEETKTPFMVMELLVGEDLATRLERTGPFSPTEVIDLFEQLCHAMTAAHEAGIVHRDLKPENIFLSSSKRAGGDGTRVDVKVLDFGIAKLVAETSAKAGTQGMIGTPFWMAPEQTEPGKVTPAADVWALGLIFYRALTGRVFWKSGADASATFSQVMKEICLGAIPSGSIRAREQGVFDRWHIAFDQVLGLCLQRDPSKRFAHAGFFWANLKEALLPFVGPQTSDRIIAAERSSARILAGASPANALDATAATPRPAPAALPLPTPDPLAKPALLSSSFGNLGEIAGVPIKALATAVATLLFVGLFLYVSALRHRAENPPPQEPSTMILTAPPTTTNTVPTTKAAPRCRLCTVDVITSGPLAKDEIRTTVEAALPTLAAQCMPKDGRGRMRRANGTAVIAFTVREGHAVNRRALSGDGECYVRGLGDVPFPAHDSGTDVTYTLRFDSSVE